MRLIRIYNKLRTMFWTKLTKFTCGSYQGKIKVNRRCVIGNNVHLGRNVNFNGMSISPGGKVIIGDNFHSGVNCRIIAQNHNYKGSALPYDNTYIRNTIVIKDNVWLGDNVIVLGNVTIGEGAIIQAGSVVVKDIPKCAIAGGHPAAAFSYRDMIHYEKLKAEKSFF